jgi:uncharacterized membrane protein
MLPRLAIVASFVAVTFCGAVAVAQTYTTYTITDLGSGSVGAAGLPYNSMAPAAINSSGQIVGTAYAYTSSGTVATAFLYDASSSGAKTAIAPFGTTSYSTANGINNSGQFVGSVYDTYTDGTNYYYQYDAYTASISAQTYTTISFDNTSYYLPAAYVGSATSGQAINNSNVVAGTTVLPLQTGDTVYTQYGFTYDPNAPSASAATIFPSPSSFHGSGIAVSNNGINDSGVVVGTWGTSSGFHMAYYYDPSSGLVSQINTPLDNTNTGLSYYAEANGINNSGEVIGGAVQSTAGTFHAYY